MANANTAQQPLGAPAPRKLSSARPDEEAPRGEFWVLLRSVAMVVAFVVVVGWLIG